MALGLALGAVVVALSLAVAAVGVGVGTYVSASNAADAAALAAAPVTFRPFGAAGSPAREAARYAAINGATLVSCQCPLDPSWDARTVTVQVVRRVDIPGIGVWHVTATSRATFEPAALLPEPPVVSPAGP
jgi:hypothetical protein